MEKRIFLDRELTFKKKKLGKDFPVKVKEKCVVQKQKPASVTDKLDKVFLNKWLAIPIFVAIMALVYYLSVGVVGTYTVDLVDSGVTWFSDTVNAWLTNLGASDWAISLLCDGMIAGVGAVLTFVPQLIILFILIGWSSPESPTSGVMQKLISPILFLNSTEQSQTEHDHFLKCSH